MNNRFFLLIGVLFILFLVVGCSAPGQGPTNGLTQKYAYIALTVGETYTIDLGEMVGGATPPYSCALNSTLPMDFTIDGCTLTVTAKLNPGSTQFISPPILLVVTDSANKSISLNFDIRVYQEIPEIAPKIGAYCVVDQECGVLLATAIKGTEPYTFKAGSFTSAPPMGTSIDNYGYLAGTPSREGEYNIDICVTDAVGATDCGVVSVSVINEEDAAAYEEYATNADDEYAASGGASSDEEGNKTISLTLSKQGSGKVFITDRDTNITTECVDTCKYDYVVDAGEYSSKLVYIDATPSEGYWLGNMTGAASKSTSSFDEEGEDHLLVSLDGPNEEIKVIFYKDSKVKITSLKCEQTGEISSTNMVIYSVIATGTAFAESPGANLEMLERYDDSEAETIICGEWFAPEPGHKKYEHDSTNCVRYSGESNTKWSYADTYNYASEASELCVAIYESDYDQYGPYSYDCASC